MSTNSTAYTMIGCKIPYDKFVTKQQVKAFKHSYDKNMKFDPYSGKKLWREHEILPNGENLWDKDTFEGLRILTPYHDAQFFYVGHIVGEISEYGECMNLDSLKHLKAQSIRVSEILNDYDEFNDLVVGFLTILRVF